MWFYVNRVLLTVRIDQMFRLNYNFLLTGNQITFFDNESENILGNLVLSDYPGLLILAVLVYQTLFNFSQLYGGLSVGYFVNRVLLSVRIQNFRLSSFKLWWFPIILLMLFWHVRKSSAFRHLWCWFMMPFMFVWVIQQRQNWRDNFSGATEISPSGWEQTPKTSKQVHREISQFKNINEFEWNLLIFYQ